MSSSLYLFDLHRHPAPAPGSFEDLESLRKALHPKPDAKNLRFIEFALRFEEKFPPVAAGTRSPLEQARSLRTAAWQFDLPHIDTMVAYRAAVEIAASLDLVAYDAELGVGFLPDGKVIPDEFGQSPESSADDTLRGETEVRAVLEPALVRATVLHGFVLDPERTEGHAPTIWLSRQLGPVRQRIRVGLARYEQLSISLLVQHDACTALCEKALGPEAGEQHAFELYFGFFSPGPESSHKWELERRQQLGAVLEMIRDKLLPLAELCRDLGGIDQMQNDASADTIRTPYKTAWSWQGRPHGSDGSLGLREHMLERSHRLVVAHLNSNPSTSQIVDWFENYFTQPRPPRVREQYLKLREALAATAPLVSWPDEQAYRASMRPIPLSLQQRAIDPRERRCHHWEVTEALHQAVTNDPAAFWERFANGDGDAELQRLWQEKADSLPASDRIDPAGLACDLTTLTRPERHDIQLLRLTFPAIRGLDEVAVLALARSGTTYRKYMMGHELMLNDNAVTACMVFASGGGTTRKTLPALLSAEKLVDFVRDTFE